MVRLTGELRSGHTAQPLNLGIRTAGTGARENASAESMRLRSASPSGGVPLAPDSDEATRDHRPLLREMLAIRTCPKGAREGAASRMAQVPECAR